MFKEHLENELSRPVGEGLSRGVGMSMRDVFAAIAEVREMHEAVKDVLEAPTSSNGGGARGTESRGSEGSGEEGLLVRPRTRESFGARPRSRDSFGRPYSRESELPPARGRGDSSFDDDTD